jgi:hypothetical protein
MFSRTAVSVPMTVLALVISIAAPASAHSPYLLPNSFDLDRRDHVGVQSHTYALTLDVGE